MATFIGKQPGTDDPTMRHEGELAEWTGSSTFKGVQAGDSDPTIAGGMKRLYGDAEPTPVHP